MGEVKGKTFLDLGCGARLVAITAALSGAEKVYAIDIMPEAYEIAQRYIVYNNASDLDDFLLPRTQFASCVLDLEEYILQIRRRNLTRRILYID